MKRREFLSKTALTGAGAAAVTTATTMPMPAIAQGKVEWRMVTTWPKNFPGFGASANRIAERINQMSDGRMTVKVYSAGELVPALEALDAVMRGSAEMSHGASYYWQGKSKALNFFTGVPFGMTAPEISAWMRYMGGQELFDEVYAQFGIKAFLSGQTGCQAGGWFRKEIKSVADIKGIKFRTPGLGGEVWRRLGATVVNLPGGEIFQALQSGALDAAEFVSPMTDLALGFHQVTKNYYFPSFIEPGLATELACNKEKLMALPKDLQRIVEFACQADYDQTFAEFQARNATALETLVNKHGVQIKKFPEDVMKAGGAEAGKLLVEMRDGGDVLTKKVVESYVWARKLLRDTSRIADAAYLEARELPFQYL